jgi:hypothetical protein
MWSKKDKVWMHYIHDIIAADVASGVFLAHYMRQMRMAKTYAAALEVVDLQRYKVIRKTRKVLSALNDADDSSFVFVVGKN